jgi:uncharacterized membrane protein
MITSEQLPGYWELDSRLLTGDVSARSRGISQVSEPGSVIGLFCLIAIPRLVDAVEIVMHRRKWLHVAVPTLVLHQLAVADSDPE